MSGEYTTSSPSSPWQKRQIVSLTKEVTLYRLLIMIY